jgi:hypothetical protein
MSRLSLASLEKCQPLTGNSGPKRDPNGRQEEILTAQGFSLPGGARQCNCIRKTMSAMEGAQMGSPPARSPNVLRTDHKVFAQS